MKKIYYQWKFKALSPLAVGSGLGENTDSDVLVNCMGVPFIPGSAIAGMLRAQCNQDIADEIFGNINHNEAEQSLVYTYDANMVEGDCNITIRDSVNLDENKTAVKGAKFDMEAVEPGVTFITYLEIGSEKPGADGGIQRAEAELERILSNLGKFVMGAKTTRGYGRLETISVKKKAYDLPAQAKEWLDFDMFGINSFESGTPIATKHTVSENTMVLKAKLKINGSPMIRRYTTEIGSADGNNPDMVQLCLKGGKPVIPGTSWAGAFRHHCKTVSVEMGIDEQTARSNIDELFGYVNKKTGANGQTATKRSSVVFSESQIDGSDPKTVTRTAVDRFTGGASDKALFTEKFYYGGTTELIITVHNVAAVGEEMLNVLFVTLADLHNGILAVGGETSVGHGLFQVAQLMVNGKNVSDAFDKYNFRECYREVIEK